MTRTCRSSCASFRLRVVCPLPCVTGPCDPSWSNNSRRLAFSDLFYGYVGTVGLDGTETKFDFDTLGSDEGYGCNPAYSPDGKLIVYERYECYFGVPGPLMAIPVDAKGRALGSPYPITSGAYYASHPSFSNDGKTIVFSANAGSDPTERVSTPCPSMAAMRWCCSTGPARASGMRLTRRTAATSCSRARSNGGPTARDSPMVSGQHRATD